ncbi:MAG: EpsI family protein [Gemmatimonadota bacterium]|nr:EpsI family protein [Gemmatimonadota bacterium]
MVNLRSYAPAIILAVGAILVWSGRGQREVPLASHLDTVLPSVSGYRTYDQKITDEERRVAGMSDYISRVYARDTVVAFTTLVSYYDRQTRGRSIHSPKNCLPGAGWEVLSSGTDVVISNGASYEVNRYILKKGVLRAVVYYWYQGRGRVVASEYAVKWNLLRDAAFRGHTEEALVRVVVPVRSPPGSVRTGAEPSYSEATALAKTIAGRLIPEVDRVLPRVSQG